MIGIKDNSQVYNQKSEDCRNDYETVNSLSLENSLSSDKGFSLEDARGDFLRHLGETAAAILHEVRNPLQTTRAFIQNMERSFPKNSDFAEYFPLILDELERADLLLKDYLRFTRQEPPLIESASLITLCRETIMLVRSGAALKGISLEESYPKQDVFLMVDAQRIRQVLLNLILNAFDACIGGGRVKIKVKLKPKEVLLGVEDNGCGIEGPRLKHIFDPFYTTKPKGTGLGLCLCCKIIHSHGGYLKVYSKGGRGTVFTIVFPRPNPGIA